ncbi:MAG: hypothetical protein JWQ27_471 [Ferruginibacter sp.]|nr:hypothetical protein [Ferruginibacter sp.]
MRIDFYLSSPGELNKIQMQDLLNYENYLRPNFDGFLLLSYFIWLNAIFTLRWKGEKKKDRV